MAQRPRPRIPKKVVLPPPKFYEKVPSWLSLPGGVVFGVMGVCAGSLFKGWLAIGLWLSVLGFCVLTVLFMLHEVRNHKEKGQRTITVHMGLGVFMVFGFFAIFSGYAWRSGLPLFDVEPKAASTTTPVALTPPQPTQSQPSKTDNGISDEELNASAISSKDPNMNGRIDHVWINGFPGDGIAIRNAAHLSISDAEIKGNAGAGISLPNNTNTDIQRPKIEKNNGPGILQRDAPKQ
jgi:hypothetical protein